MCFQNCPEALKRWVCSMATFAFSEARSVKLCVESCEQFMCKTLRSPAVSVSPSGSASHKCHCKEHI